MRFALLLLPLALLVQATQTESNNGSSEPPSSDNRSKTEVAFVPAFMGIEFQWNYDRGRTHHIRVVQVASGGPAERAGVRSGDIVTHIGELPVNFGDQLDFLLFMREQRPGERLTLSIIRDGMTKELVVELGALPDEARERWEESLRTARARRAAVQAAEEEKRSKERDNPDQH